MKRIHFQTTTSTNYIAREYLDQGCDETTLITADCQVSGKGQYDRSFSSPQGGLYFSIIFRPLIDTRYIPLITLATGVACADCIAGRYGLVPMLKWPNDIYVGDRKLGGILCESIISPVSEAWVIVGVGINVNTSLNNYPSDIAETLTTIRDLTGENCEPDKLLGDLTSAIIEETALLGQDSDIVLRQWRQYDYLLGRSVRYSDGPQELRGIGRGLDGNGMYCLEDYSGKKHSILGGTLRPA